MKTLNLIIILLIIGISTNAQNIENLHERADSLYHKEKYDEAKKIYSKIIKLDSKNAKAYNRKGNCFLSMEEIDSAKIFFETAILIDPNYASSYYNLGIIYLYQEENIDLALAKMKEAIRIEPDTAKFWAYAGNCFYFKSQADSTLYYYDKAIEVEPNYTDAYYFKATLFYEQEKFDMALQTLQEAIDHNATHNYIFLFKSQIESGQGNYEAALQDCNRGIELKPDYMQAYEMRAELYFFLDSAEAVIEECKFILGKNPENTGVIYLISWTYLQIQEYEQALFYAKKGIELDPYSEELYKVIGIIYFYSLNFTNAVEYFDKAIELNPNDMQCLDYKSQSIVYSKTDRKIFDENLLFLTLNLSNIKHIENQITDKKSQYYFKTLNNKFEKDKTSLTLDEYFMLYYGQTQQKKYSAYNTDNNIEFKKLFGIGNYDACIESAKQSLSENPFNIEAYLYVSYSYFYLSQPDMAIEYLTPYQGLLCAISATGDGLTPETAYIVASVADEYYMMYFLGLTTVKQKFISENGHNYDVITGRDSVGNEIDVYFLIDSFFDL